MEAVPNAEAGSQALKRMRHVAREIFPKILKSGVIETCRCAIGFACDGGF